MRILKTTAAAAAFMGLATAAHADGMSGSYKDAPVSAPVYSWTGFYIGAGAGAGAVVHELDVGANYYDSDCYDYSCTQYSEKIGSLNFDGIGGEGAFGTLQIGYDREVHNKWVLGVFFDYDFSSIETELSFNLGGVEGINGKGGIEQDYMWTLGGRIGYLVNPDTLIYGLIGYSEAKFDNPSLTLSAYGDSLKLSTNLDEFSGITLGAGMETRLHGNWFLKGEYRFTQLDSEKLFSVDNTSPCGYEGEVKCGYDVNADLEPSIHTGRLVLTYKFNWHHHEAVEPLK